MKVLVTGATGFIGNHVVTELLQNNHTVIASSLHPEKAKEFPWFNEVKYHPLNLSGLHHQVDYFQYFNAPDIIIHLAWEGLPNYLSLEHIEKNLFSHYQFLKNLVANGATHITISGTCMEYGLREGVLSEEMMPNPANPYSIAKDCLRKFLEQLQINYPFDLKWVRLFYMYGKGQHPNAILAQLEAAVKKGEKEFKMSKGEQQRDYLPVETVAEYLVKIALQNKESGIINCCSGVPVSINQLVDNYLKEKQQPLRLNKGFYAYPDYEPMNFWGSTAKLHKIIG